MTDVFEPGLDDVSVPRGLDLPLPDFTTVLGLACLAFMGWTVYRSVKFDREIKQFNDSIGPRLAAAAAGTSYEDHRVGRETSK
jgi:hypothetical protein